MLPSCRCILFSSALTGLLLWLAPCAAQAQQADSLAGLSGKLAHYQQQAIVEKLFVHLDQPTHSAGETIWLKIYATDGTTHRPLALSRVAYVEVLDAGQKPVAQASIALRQGSGHGALNLPAQLASGRYTVRAYTRWMQNFGPEFFFHAPLTILNTFSASGTGVAQQALGYDVQFFPEGGQLVQGLASRVGFKIMDSEGRSVPATGTVADASGKQVATFSTLKYGMGSFPLLPARAGVAYTATVQLATGKRLTMQLPSVQPQGYVLSLQSENDTSLRLTVQAAGPALATEVVQVLGHAGQRVSLAAKATLVDGRATFLLKKNALPDGISHFTVFNARRQPVAERLYFSPVRHRLALTTKADKSTYLPREKVALQVAASANADASLAVYRLDSLSTAHPADIASWLLLAADLKGAIEDPGYYLRDSSTAGQAAADNLMLTQGWSRFRWQDVLAAQPPSLPYVPELYGPVIQAQVLTAAGTPAPAGIGTYLTIPSRTGRFYYAPTQANGLVQFEPEPFVATQQVILQTDFSRDSTYRLEFRSPYTTRHAPIRWAPLALTPALAPALAERQVQAQVAQYFASPAPIAATKTVTDSASFFGKPDERYLLDDYTRFKTMEEVMREYVSGALVRKRRNGFHFLVLDRPGQAYFKHDPLVLLDGLPIFNTNEIMAFDPLKVKQTDVLTVRYYQGPLVYDGVVSYTTYRGDLGGFPINPHALVEEYEGPQGERQFYAPRYENAQQQQSRLADLRNLLHWQPQLLLQPNQPTNVTFYTSDQAGRYLVVAQGLAADGRPGSTSFTFEVKPAL